MKKLQHDNIIKLIEELVSENIYLVMEYAPGGNLYDYEKNKNQFMKESEARTKFGQICKAINYCHELNIAHR